MTTTESFRQVTDPYTGLKFGCSGRWGVQCTELGCLLLADAEPLRRMLILTKVFSIRAFDRADDPRLYRRLAAYLSEIDPDHRRVTQKGSPTWAEAFGAKGVVLRWALGSQDVFLLLAVQGDFLVTLRLHRVPAGQGAEASLLEDVAISMVLPLIFRSFQGDIQRSNRLYFRDEPDPTPIFARGDIDEALVGSWRSEQYSGGDFSITTESYLNLFEYGRFTKERQTDFFYRHRDSGGNWTDTTSGGSRSPSGTAGSWWANGSELYLEWDDGTWASYSYEVSRKSLLLTSSNGRETYWERD